MQYYFIGLVSTKTYSKNIYLFKVNNRNTRKSYEICSKLTIKTPERHQWLWTYFTAFSSVSIVDFEQVNVSWGSKNIFFRTDKVEGASLKKVAINVSLSHLISNKSYFYWAKESTKWEWRYVITDFRTST